VSADYSTANRAKKFRSSAVSMSLEWVLKRARRHARFAFEIIALRDTRSLYSQYAIEPMGKLAALPDNDSPTRHFAD
jgi:hypothetical protein